MLCQTFSSRAFCQSLNIIMYVRSLAPNEVKKCWRRICRRSEFGTLLVFCTKSKASVYLFIVCAQLDGIGDESRRLLLRHGTNISQPHGELHKHRQREITTQPQQTCKSHI